VMGKAKEAALMGGKAEYAEIQRVRLPVVWLKGGLTRAIIDEKRQATQWEAMQM
jgi:hypothetical protein